MMTEEFTKIGRNTDLNADIVTDASGNPFLELDYKQLTACLYAVLGNPEKEKQLESALGLTGFFNFKRRPFQHALGNAEIFLVHKTFYLYKGSGAEEFPKIFDQVNKEIIGGPRYSMLRDYFRKFSSLDQEKIIDEIGEAIILESFGNLDIDKFRTYKKILVDYLTERDKKFRSIPEIYIVKSGSVALGVVNFLRAEKGLEPKLYLED